MMMNPKKQPQNAPAGPNNKDLILKMTANRLFPAVVLVLVAFSVYCNSLSNGFVYDDYAVIVDNKYLKLPGIDFASFFNQSYFSIAAGESSYRPVATLSYFLLYKIGGLNPFFYHLLSVVLHVLNVILVYLLADALLKPRFAALIAALLFAAHPAMTEAVNCISYNEDLLTAFFFLLAFLCYMKIETLSLKSGMTVYALSLFALSLFFFLLAVLSKEMAITLPAIIVLYDLSIKHATTRTFSLMSLAAILKDRWHFYAGFIAVSLFFLTIRFFLLIDPQDPIKPDYGSLFERIIYLPGHIFRFFKLAVWPVNLTADYVFSYPSGFWTVSNIIGVAVVLGLAGLSFYIYKFSREIFFSIWWFLLALFPVYNLIPIFNPFAERYLYLPLVGFCLAFAVLLNEIPVRRFSKPAWARILTMLAVLVVIGLYSTATIARNRDWHSGLTLWSKAVISSPDSSIAHGSLGRAYQDKGRLDDAIRQYEKAIELSPINYKAYYNLGVLYDSKNDFEKAVQNYQHAIAINPAFANAYFNLGNIYHKQGLLDEAIQRYQKVTEIDPADFEARNNLGVAYAMQGKLDKAMAQWEKVLKTDPQNKSAADNLKKAKKMVE